MTAPDAMAGKSVHMSILGVDDWPPSALGATLANDRFVPYARRDLGYDVTFSYEAAPFARLFDTAAASLSTGASGYNIIISDSQWLGALVESGWITQLDGIIAQNPDLDITFEETAEQGYRVYPDGTDMRWGFPQEGDTIALYVRQDLFSDPDERDTYRAANAGESLPETFEDWEQVDIDRFERIVAFFHRPDQGYAGTSLQFSKVYDDISCFVYPFMFSTGGDIWNGEPDSWQVEGVLDSAINGAALARAKEFLAYGPENMTDIGIPEEVDAFTAGKLATCLQWSSLGFSMLNIDENDPSMPADASKPVNRDNVIIVPPPGFRQPDSTLKRLYTLGGQSWVINAFNPPDQMRVAVDFLSWWYRPETQQEFARRGGNPTDTATLNAPAFDTMQPQFRAYRYMLQGNSRDFWHDPHYAAMLAVQQEAFSAYMTDAVTNPMDALRYAACRQQGILYDNGRTDVAPSQACEDINLG